MPAARLGPSSVALKIYDLVGSDSDLVGGLIQHVGIVDPEQSEVSNAVQVTVVHMGPPLQINGQMAAHVVGSTGLTLEEVNQIKNFIDENLSEHQAQILSGTPKYATYLICPHFSSEEWEDGTPIYNRFSCVGFAIEAYRDAGIDLLVTDEAQLPDVDFPMLQNAYPVLAGENGKQKLRDLNARYKWGCNGEGPWKIVLPGYLFHALRRIDAGSRGGPKYVPQKGDERFV